MNVRQTSDKRFSVTVKLQLVVFTIVFLIIGVQTWLNISSARQRNEADTKQFLIALYHEYNEEINLFEKTAAALSLSFANRPDIQAHFQAKDRQALLALLEPIFMTLKENYNIVHLQFHDPNGFIFLRIHDPGQYGDYTFSYRRANTAAIISRQTVAGIEIDPNRLGIQGVSPMFHRGQFIGLVEVGLDYDRAFIAALKARNGADYKMWVTHTDAKPAALGPAADAPESPSDDFFYYAGTNPIPLPIPAELYQTILRGGEPQIQFVFANNQDWAVLVAPMLGYGDRIIGLLEISISRKETLATLQHDQQTTLAVAAGLAILALVLLWISTRRVVLRPLSHLTAVTRRRLEGDLTARVEHLPRDEFGQLGHTFNILTNSLDATLKNQENIIAERTAQLEATNRDLRVEINERKQAEEALRRWGHVFEHAEWGVVVDNPDNGTLEMVNPAFARMHGYTVEELIGTPLSEVFAPNYRPKVADYIRLAHEKGHYTFESEHIHEGGTTFPVIVDVSVVKDTDGKSLYRVANVQDITELKRAEAALKEYSERLEELVKERTKELQEAQEQLIRREKLVILGQLAGGVAHELRNPLGVIANSAYFLQMTLPEADEMTKEYLEIILTRVQESEKIISALLNISRTKSAEREEIPVSDLVAEVLARNPPPEIMTVTTDLPPDLPLLYIDSQQMMQVLANLVTNAYQAMPHGGQLTISAQAEGKWVRLCVADTGLGMSPQTMEKIFEPLYTTKAKGIGLGLAVSKNLVEVNGGAIAVESLEGQGTTFTVTLPIREKPTDKPETAKRTNW